jgi:hypothetical protein
MQNFQDKQKQVSRSAIDLLQIREAIEHKACVLQYSVSQFSTL